MNEGKQELVQNIKKTDENPPCPKCGGVLEKGKFYIRERPFPGYERKIFEKDLLFCPCCITDHQKSAMSVWGHAMSPDTYENKVKGNTLSPY